MFSFKHSPLTKTSLHSILHIEIVHIVLVSLCTSTFLPSLLGEIDDGLRHLLARSPRNLRGAMKNTYMRPIDGNGLHKMLLQCVAILRWRSVRREDWRRLQAVSSLRPEKWYWERIVVSGWLVTLRRIRLT